MTRLRTTRGTNEPDKDDDVRSVSRAAVGGRLAGGSGRDDVDHARSLRPSGRAPGATRMVDSGVAELARTAGPDPAGARHCRDIMSKSPLGYTEASNAIPPGGSPDSSASSEAAGAAVTTERFGHADRMKDHRILVVDDEPASRKGLKELLTVWGYEVSAAADGQEALERAAAPVPALVDRRPGHARDRRARAAARLKRDFPDHGGHAPDRPGHHRDRRGGDQGRRLRLPDQAGRSAAPAASCSTRRSSAARRCARCSVLRRQLRRARRVRRR